MELRGSSTRWRAYFIPEHVEPRGIPGEYLSWQCFIREKLSKNNLKTRNFELLLESRSETKK